LPLPPEAVLERYWHVRGCDPGPENDLAILVGLLLRGWRKGYDAEAGITLASGVSARDDLAWWCERAVEAAGRILEKGWVTPSVTTDGRAPGWTAN
jgi:hypothetical protein